jgi:hypothetical protein
MSYRYLLTLLGSTLILLGITKGGWLLMSIWLGIDFLILGIAHGRGAHGVLGKRTDGTLPGWSWMLFLPLHLYTIGLWHVVRLLGREPACNVVTDKVVVGRRLLPSEQVGEFENYVDLTAEFAEPGAVRRSESYRSFPILDGAAPSAEALRAAIAQLRPGRTFIHCAQGHGRTGLFTVAVLLQQDGVQSLEGALQMLRSARPGIQLNQLQRDCIQRYAEELGA